MKNRKEIKKLCNIIKHSVKSKDPRLESWLDINKEDERAFIQGNQDDAFLENFGPHIYDYYCISELTEKN